MLNLSFSSSFKRPEVRRYSVTTLEPGARLVLTQGCDFRPRAAAFFATRPAATSTYGFEVLVHEVIAAMTTLPCESEKRSPPSSACTEVARSLALTAGAAPLPFALAAA